MKGSGCMPPETSRSSSGVSSTISTTSTTSVSSLMMWFSFDVLCCQRRRGGRVRRRFITPYMLCHRDIFEFAVERKYFPVAVLSLNDAAKDVEPNILGRKTQALVRVSRPRSMHCTCKPARALFIQSRVIRFYHPGYRVHCDLRFIYLRHTHHHQLFFQFGDSLLEGVALLRPLLGVLGIKL